MTKQTLCTASIVRHVARVTTGISHSEVSTQTDLRLEGRIRHCMGTRVPGLKRIVHALHPALSHRMAGKAQPALAVVPYQKVERVLVDPLSMRFMAARALHVPLDQLNGLRLICRLPRQVQ